MNNANLLNVLDDPTALSSMDFDLPEDMSLLNNAYATYLQEEYIEKQLANCILNEIDQLDCSENDECWARVFNLEELESDLLN